MKNLIITIVAAALSCYVIYLVPYGQALDVIGLLLGVVAAIYIGFAIADGRKDVIYIECSIATLFILLAILGMWGKPVWLVIGYFAHGLWNLVHNRAGIKTNVRKWFPPLCLLYDWLVGVYLLFWLDWL